MCRNFDIFEIQNPAWLEILVDHNTQKLALLLPSCQFLTFILHLSMTQLRTLTMLISSISWTCWHCGSLFRLYRFCIFFLDYFTHWIFSYLLMLYYYFSSSLFLFFSFWRWWGKKVRIEFSLGTNDTHKVYANLHWSFDIDVDYAHFCLAIVHEHWAG